MISNEDVLYRLIPYRLNAVDAFSVVLRLRNKWDKAQTMQLFFNGDLAFEGNSNAFVNPVIETGVIHCRALLEFLGLSTSNAGSLQRLRSRRKDDVGIERFSNAAGPLALVSPEEAVSRWPGGEDEAEQALLSVFRAANKGLAHFTSTAIVSSEETRLLEIASRGVPSLVVSYLYTPLGLNPPVYQLSSRSREKS
jgi:hypothetical protein